MTFCAIPAVRSLLVKLPRGILAALPLFFMVALSCICAAGQSSRYFSSSAAQMGQSQ